jgi:hypothetical protein
LRKIPVASAIQDFVAEGQGVSFTQKYDSQQSCLKAWEDMFLDMYLLSQCNTVVAGQYSSFSQSSPFSLILQQAMEHQNKNTHNASSDLHHHHQQHPHYFCQIGAHGDNIECLNKFLDWYTDKAAVFFGNETSPKQRLSREIQFPTVHENFLKGAAGIGNNTNLSQEGPPQHGISKFKVSIH